MKDTIVRIALLFSFVAFTAYSHLQPKPTLYIIGDFTVRNDDSTGNRGWTNAKWSGIR